MADEKHAPSRDFWLRHTDTDGKSYVREHRVWDGELFLASQQDAARNLNEGQKPGKSRLAKVEQITQEQYLKERTK